MLYHDLLHQLLHLLPLRMSEVLNVEVVMLFYDTYINLILIPL